MNRQVREDGGGVVGGHCDKMYCEILQERMKKDREGKKHKDMDKLFNWALFKKQSTSDQNHIITFNSLSHQESNNKNHSDISFHQVIESIVEQNMNIGGNVEKTVLCYTVHGTGN